MVDLSYLRSICGNDPVFVKKMISSYLHLAPTCIQEMKRACERGSWSELSLQAHKLKPSATYMGIDGLREVILQIEELGKGQRPKKTELCSLIKQVEQLCRQSYALLKEEIT